MNKPVILCCAILLWLFATVLTSPAQAEAPTQTPTSTPTHTPTVTNTSTATHAPTITSTPSPVSMYLPLIWRALPSLTPTPTQTPTRTPFPLIERLVCVKPAITIPDNNAGGASSSIYLDEPGYLRSIDIYVRISHTWVGDVAIELVQRSTGAHSILADRPGRSFYQQACPYDNLQAIFRSQGNWQGANTQCLANGAGGSIVPVAVGGTFQPVTSLAGFLGQPAAGEYSLLVADNNFGDVGILDHWCLHTWSGELAEPTPTPTPVSLPASAQVQGMSGKDQALPLDCETRSAVDWASHFGFSIDELTFFNQLPRSDNPDRGFVGSVYGAWGNIPPNAYGIHAGPMAALLRAYGVTAQAYQGLSLRDLQAELVSGRPAIVWVTGHVQAGAPQFYTASSDSGISTVARYEHTVIITGYTQANVTILDGSSVYTVSIDRFLDAWGALGNMAVLGRP